MNSLWVLLFVVAMLFSIVHGIRLLRRTRRTGPEYWVGRFRQACERRDPQQAAQALLMWSRMRWPGAAPANLAALGEALESADARRVLEKLKQALSSGTKSNLWDNQGCAEVMLPLIESWRPAGKGETAGGDTHSGTATDGL